MNRALESMLSDLLATGVALYEAREVRGLYARALNRQGTASWIAFYRGVFAALHHTAAVAAQASSAAQNAARASLLRLIEDDLGSTLFSPSELKSLRARLTASPSASSALFVRPRLLEERQGRDAILQL